MMTIPMKQTLLISSVIYIIILTGSESQSLPVQRNDIIIPEDLRFFLIQKLLENLPSNYPQNSLVRKRNCYINAGLSHGCDYKDLIGAQTEKAYWDSTNSPGRRRRSLRQEPSDNLSSQQASSYEFSSET
ncbi:UNVERIFIED_CONTAM: hypothetical protein RMT77_004862 [Armadillidium vulgare]